jgi:hypothetical protein
MTVREERWHVIGEEDVALPWGNALKHAPAVLALSALAIYGYLSICYEGFYRALGIDPGDVGLSYAAILAHSSGFVIAGSIVLLWAITVLFLGPDMHHRAARRNPRMARRVLAVERLVGFALVATLFNQVFVLAEEAARDVKAGHAVHPLRPPVPDMSVPLTILAIHADPATVEPAVKPGDSPAVERLRGRRLLYLGQAGGTIVLYDAAAQRAVYVPASAVILQVANCRAKPPPDPAC